jgi:DNA adenine methylase
MRTIVVPPIARVGSGIARVNIHPDRGGPETLAAGASKLSSVTPRPFLKWAGSKRLLLKELAPNFPSQYRRYWEPFLGSGALFFFLRPRRATLSDRCGPLISTWKAVRDAVEGVLTELTSLKPTRTQYYAIREHPSGETLRQAAEFIYLNKTCWNGLYRVNLSGRFNVPFGTPDNGRIVDPDNLRACANALAHPAIRLECNDFESALHGVKPSDFVFLDPPYVTHHDDNGFVDYNEILFSWTDQERLARVARSLAKRGAYVIVTNSANRGVLSLYSGFNRRVVKRQSTLASKSRHRASVREAIICSPNCPDARATATGSEAWQR